jgi:dynamin family protein
MAYFRRVWKSAKGARADAVKFFMTLVDQLSDYSRWRAASAEAVGRLRAWLNLNEVGDAQSDLRLQYVLDRLRDDKLVVAFVAEFSRGKSELINAIFFSDFGDRILPSSAGRTTMCPTELQWSPGASQEIRLLPIETRANHATVSELKRLPEHWTTLPLQADSAQELQEALARVGETKRVTQVAANELGFAIDPQGSEGLKPGMDGLVEIPRWRHALIQFPHPLLEQGLVVLDTPGLNAIGAEPELTLSLLPNAHAVLFILGIDTGVTQSDLTVWRDYVQSGSGRQKGRLVVLNKIDSLWDGLRDEARIDAEIAAQVSSVAETLDTASRHVFPVSAQKGLVGRITADQALVARSRLPVLEKALSEDLLPTKREIVRDNTLGEAEDLIERARNLLDARLSGLREQLGELTDLRGKNQNVIEYMMRKIRSEKDEFEQGLQKYYAVRSVFSNLTNNLLGHLGLDALRDETRRTREAMLESAFSRGLREAMEQFFVRIRANLKNSSDEVAEITRMLEAMHKRFSVEHGLTLAAPAPFSTLRYEQEIDRLEKAFNSQINTTLTLATTEKHTLTQKFFDTVAVQARRTFEVANRDVEQWLRAVMSPLEIQVREYQMQLKRRLESVKRIHQATDTLEDRVMELREAEAALLRQISDLAVVATNLRDVLGAGEMAEDAPASLAA